MRNLIRGYSLLEALLSLSLSASAILGLLTLYSQLATSQSQNLQQQYANLQLTNIYEILQAYPNHQTTIVQQRQTQIQRYLPQANLSQQYVSRWQTQLTLSWMAHHQNIEPDDCQGTGTICRHLLMYRNNA